MLQSSWPHCQASVDEGWDDTCDILGVNRHPGARGGQQSCFIFSVAGQQRSSISAKHQNFSRGAKLWTEALLWMAPVTHAIYLKPLWRQLESSARVHAERFWVDFWFRVGLYAHKSTKLRLELLIEHTAVVRLLSVCVASSAKTWRSCSRMQEATGTFWPCQIW